MSRSWVILFSPSFAYFLQSSFYSFISLTKSQLENIFRGFCHLGMAVAVGALAQSVELAEPAHIIVSGIGSHQLTFRVMEFGCFRFLGIDRLR